MTEVEKLTISDLRPRLSVIPNPKELRDKGIISRKARRGTIQGVTFHYNGPSIGFRSDYRRVLDFIAKVDVPNHQQRIGADSLQYHFVILDDGSIWQTRDLGLIAWHCGHPWANEYTIAVHFPVGGIQDVTEAAWASGVRLAEALRADNGFGKQMVRGHKEWGKSECPGTKIQPRIEAYRKTVEELPVRGQPTIGVERFVSVLSNNRSPAAPYGNALYQICVDEGISPAVALAFFEHESSYGTKGICKDYDTKSWGNVRTKEDPAAPGLQVAVSNRGFYFAYLSWEDSLRDWCKRLKGPKYAGAGLTTVEQIIPKYAPSSDGNVPQRYIDAVRAAVQTFENGEISKWVCINPRGVYIRTAPNTNGKVAGAIKPGEIMTVQAVKTNGDVETIRGDNRWLHLASGLGFVWAGNFKRSG